MTNPARIKANSNFRVKAYDRLEITVPKGAGPELRRLAAEAGRETVGDCAWMPSNRVWPTEKLKRAGLCRQVGKLDNTQRSFSILSLYHSQHESHHPS